jgi:hypothetical protein
MSRQQEQEQQQQQQQQQSAYAVDDDFQDDEEYARMLQYQEQSAVLPEDSNSISMLLVDEQELQDLQLAREMARREMEGPSLTCNNPASRNTNGNHPIHQNQINGNSHHTGGHSLKAFEDSISLPLNAWSRALNSSHAKEYYTRSLSDSATPQHTFRGEQMQQDLTVLNDNRPGDTTDALTYARQLQMKAFQSLDCQQRRRTQSQETISLETSDMELAWKMQQIEISNASNQNLGTNSSASSDPSKSGALSRGRPNSASLSSFSNGKTHQEDDDLRLARYLELTGSSMRDLSVTEISTLLDSAQASHDTLHTSSGTMATIDRQIALTRMHVTPPSSGHNSPAKTTPVREYTLDSPSTFRLTQSAVAPRGQAAQRPVPQPRSVPPVNTSITHSAPSRPAGHVAMHNGFPTLDPLYSLEEDGLESRQEVTKKRGSFLRFKGKRSPVKKPSLLSVVLPPDIARGISPPPGETICGRMIDGQPDSAAPFDAVGRTIDQGPVGMATTMAPPLFSSGSRRVGMPRSPIKASSRLPAAILSEIPPAPPSSPRRGRSWMPRSPMLKDARKFVNGNGLPTAPTSDPLPHSVSAHQPLLGPASQTKPKTNRDLVCTTCGQMRGSFIIAMEKSYHSECFRCASCHDKIDPSSLFAFSKTDRGVKRPYHRKCYAEKFGIHCVVCKLAIPSNSDGIVAFVKHPFFDHEVMCPRHAEEAGNRRCTGCHRFEPESEPFADLNDNGRCVCYSCCRSVVVDSADVKPLWDMVLQFFDKLRLPIWSEMERIQLVVVQSAAMNEAIRNSTSAYKGQSQMMARGLFIPSHNQNAPSSRLVRAPSMRFERSSKSFRTMDAEGGFDDLRESTPINTILCLTGLPRDLVASILAHEGAHAWIKLHPEYNSSTPLPSQVEEGCAQLLSMLFLKEGLDPASSTMFEADGDGPSDEMLRKYFEFCIERDDTDLFGAGYQRAAAAYRDIGIEALLNHVVSYQEFPST